MPTPWDGISRMPWFQNMMRSRQGSAPGNMMSQLMNRSGQQFGNMRSNLMAGMNQPPPNPPAMGGQPPPNPPAGAIQPPPNPPAGLGMPPSIMPSPNPSAGLGALSGTGMSGDAGLMVNDAGPMVGSPTQPGPGQTPPQIGPTSGMEGMMGSLFSGGGPRPYKHGGAVEPTDGQKKAGNYKKRHITVHGLDISIENERGSTRSGTGKDGKKWSVKMPASYGYFRRSEGADGDHVDCYIGPHIKSPNVWVVDQVDADSKRWDEHKCFLGFASEAQVRRVYTAAFSDGKGHHRIGSIRKMGVDEFKHWLKNGDTSKPVAKAA